MNRRSFVSLFAGISGSLLISGMSAQAQALNVMCGPLVRSPYSPYPVQTCQAGIPSSLLDVTALNRQRASEWCWAACISGVFAYHGHPVSQERIVGETWGEIVNLPGEPEQILEDLNREWKDDNGRRFTSQGDTRTTNPVIAVEDLAQRQPLIIGALGHATILTALTYVRDMAGNGQVTLATVRDPWPFNPSRRPLTPAEWANIEFAVRIRVE